MLAQLLCRRARILRHCSTTTTTTTAPVASTLRGRVFGDTKSGLYIKHPVDRQPILLTKWAERVTTDDIIEAQLLPMYEWKTRLIPRNAAQAPKEPKTTFEPVTVLDELGETEQNLEDECELVVPAADPENLYKSSVRFSEAMSLKSVFKEVPELFKYLFRKLKIERLENLPMVVHLLPDQRLLRTAIVTSITWSNVIDRKLCGHLDYNKKNQLIFTSSSNNRLKLLIAKDPPKKIERKQRKMYIARGTSEFNPELGMYEGELVEAIDESSHEVYPSVVRILTDHRIDLNREFPETCFNELPAADYKIPTTEYLRRKDFRSRCVFTVDPPTARDLDDALHVQCLPDGELEVGVHVADVSHFVKPDTALDIEASQRCTSVYVGDRVIPMLPTRLSDHLCSLHPGEDKLTFSVLFRVKGDKIEPYWFGRGVIRSCARLSYTEADDFLQGQSIPPEKLPQIAAPFKLSNVQRSLKQLNAIAKDLRRKRIERGSLIIEKVEMAFQFGANFMPTSFSLKMRKDSSKMVEEWMLMANQAVAAMLISKLALRDAKSGNPGPGKKSKPFTGRWSGAMLRRHPEPKPEKLQRLSTLLKQARVPIDEASQLALKKTLDDALIAYSDSEPMKAVGISYLTYMSMSLANYFSVDYFLFRKPNKDKLAQHAFHYGLSAELYTHFTSPIRRYVDLLVHRQLATVLGYQEHPGSNIGRRLASQAFLCSRMHVLSKRSQEACNNLFFLATLKQTGPRQETVVVLDMKDGLAKVLIPSCGFVKSIKLSRLFSKQDGVDSLHFKQDDCLLRVKWRGEQPESALSQDIGILSNFTATIACESDSWEIDLKAVPPSRLGVQVTQTKSEPAISETGLLQL